MKGKRIALFGGSFDPPHLGHTKMVERTLSEKGIDAVWVIPCFAHPFEKRLTSFKHRLAMCRLAFNAFGKRVRVLPVEQNFKGKSYTLKTIEYLKKKYPKHLFSLLIGEDAAKDCPKWYRYKDLKEQVDWLVWPRGKNSPIPNVSATSIRKKNLEGRDVQNDAPKKVVEYILKKGLYK